MNSKLGSVVVLIHIEVVRFAREEPLLINESKQRTYKSRFLTEMKEDEYSTAK